MVLVQEVIDYIKKKEKLELRAYKDLAGIWTIGYGCTTYPDGSRVKEGDTCTPRQAEEWLKHDLEEAAGPVRNFLQAKHIELGPYQYSALVSLAYNVGPGPIITKGRSIHDALVADEFMRVADAFLLYDKVRDPKTKKLVRSRGLALRRAEERRFFLTGLH